MLDGDDATWRRLAVVGGALLALPIIAVLIDKLRSRRVPDLLQQRTKIETDIANMQAQLAELETNVGQVLTALDIPAEAGQIAALEARQHALIELKVESGSAPSRLMDLAPWAFAAAIFGVGGFLLLSPEQAKLLFVLVKGLIE